MIGVIRNGMNLLDVDAFCNSSSSAWSSSLAVEADVIRGRVEERFRVRRRRALA